MKCEEFETENKSLKSELKHLTNQINLINDKNQNAEEFKLLKAKYEYKQNEYDTLLQEYKGIQLNIPKIIDESEKVKYESTKVKKD